LCEVKLAIGMKVMVMDNVETDLDITNGAWGEIVNIIIHPDEPPIGNLPVVQLRYMPLYQTHVHLSYTFGRP
jgi:hypothetical protein